MSFRHIDIFVKIKFFVGGLYGLSHELRRVFLRCLFPWSREPSSVIFPHRAEEDPILKYLVPSRREMIRNVNDLIWTIRGLKNESSQVCPFKVDGLVSMIIWVSGKAFQRKRILFYTYIWEEDIGLLIQNRRNLIQIKKIKLRTKSPVVASDWKALLSQFPSSSRSRALVAPAGQWGGLGPCSFIELLRQGYGFGSADMQNLGQKHWKWWT